jgi:hypothetical protein
MKSFMKPALAAALLALAAPAWSQTTQEEQPVAVPDSYMEEQGQLESSDQPGVASYNIEGETSTENADGAWREEGAGFEPQTEEIKIYSGKQEGNNVVRTVQVPLPDGSGHFSYREYR